MRRTPLLIMADPGAISSGLLPDRHPILQPLWNAAANVRFYQGKVRRLVPGTAIYDQGAYFARGLHQQQNSDGVRWMIHGMVNGAGNPVITRWYGPGPESIFAPVDVLPVNDTSQLKTAQFDFAQWGDWTLFTLGVPNRPIYRYQPGVGAAALPNAPNAFGVMKKQNQVIAIGTGSNQKGVDWSDADDIVNWVSAADNLAGKLQIEELATPIRAYARLGQNIAIYSEDQLALVFWTGAPFYYGQRVVLDGIGAVGKAAVCSDGRLNYGVGRNGIWRTDGNEFNYIDEGSLNDYLQKTVNWAQAGHIVAFRNDVTRCIEFHFPTGVNAENTEAWAFDPSTGGWGKVPAFSALQERVLFDKPIAASAGRAFLLDSDVNAAGVLALTTKPLVITTADNPGLHLEGRVDEVEIAALAALNVEFKLGNAEDIDGPWEETPWQTLQPDMRTYRMPNLPSAVFHQLTFRSIAPNWDLDLQGFAFFGAIEGVKRDNI